MNHFDWLVFDWLAILCVDFGVCGDEISIDCQGNSVYDRKQSDTYLLLLTIAATSLSLGSSSVTTIP